MNELSIDLSNIRKALDELIDQPEKAHVILNIGNKFIQFASSRSEQLCLLAQLTEEEEKTLSSLLSLRGISKKRIPLFTYPTHTAEVCGTPHEFSTWLPRNTYEALRLVEDLLTEGPFDTSKGITIERSWDVSRFVHLFSRRGRDLTEDEQLAGYTETGWYFTEESFAHVQGPFESAHIAREKLDEYVAWLNQPNPEQQPRPGDGGEMGGEYDNDPAPSKVLVQGSNCACGQQLPWHLLTLGKLEHKCSCGRIYSSDGTTTRLDRQEEPEPWQNSSR